MSGLLEKKEDLRVEAMRDEVTKPTCRFTEAKYQHGFGNEFSSEALPGALPVRQNNPKKCPYGAYAEQISGTAFTAPRATNARTWLYRIMPSVTHQPFTILKNEWKVETDFSHYVPTPNQLRWKPMKLPESTEKKDFFSGMATFCGAGSPGSKDGYAIHMYSANTDMGKRCLANADGNYLIVPQQGALHVTTEMGLLLVPPGSIAVLPRGIRFKVDLPDGPSRGYVLEVYAGQFRLPDLGPIGANGLANPRDFQAPCAWYEDTYDADEPYSVIHKFEGGFFEALQPFSPFNVVAWHGNYVPYRYDLSHFCPMNAVGFDHPDPSIFTVLTCPSQEPGTAVADFVVFPPRWTVAEHTFRPPYFHRNVMSEFMGLIKGVYEAKQGSDFAPGGASLHVCMTPHGPDTAAFQEATDAADNIPKKLPEDTLAFMFEVNHTPRVTTYATSSPQLDTSYYKCWQGLKRNFDPTWKPEQ